MSASNIAQYGPAITWVASTTTMPSSNVAWDIDGPVGTLTLARPHARNALTWDMYDAIVEACDPRRRRRRCACSSYGDRAGRSRRAPTSRSSRRSRPAPTASPTSGGSARSSTALERLRMPTIAADRGRRRRRRLCPGGGLRLPRLRRHRRVRRAGGPHARQLPVARQLRPAGRPHRPGPRRRPAADRPAGQGRRGAGMGPGVAGGAGGRTGRRHRRRWPRDLATRAAEHHHRDQRDAAAAAARTAVRPPAPTTT